MFAPKNSKKITLSQSEAKVIRDLCRILQEIKKDEYGIILITNAMIKLGLTKGNNG